MYSIELTFCLIVYLIYCIFLLHLQRGVVQNTKEVPQELVGVVDRETFDKARAYAIDKGNFGLIESIYSQISSTV